MTATTAAGFTVVAGCTATGAGGAGATGAATGVEAEVGEGAVPEAAGAGEEDGTAGDAGGGVATLAAGADMLECQLQKIEDIE